MYKYTWKIPKGKFNNPNHSLKFNHKEGKFGKGKPLKKVKQFKPKKNEKEFSVEIEYEETRPSRVEGEWTLTENGKSITHKLTIICPPAEEIGLSV